MADLRRILGGLTAATQLAILERGECYGYELSRRLDAAGVGEVKGGTLYPILARLERDGLVAVRWSERSSGPARKYYLVTGAGRVQLRDGASSWLAFVDPARSILAHDATGGSS